MVSVRFGSCCVGRRRKKKSGRFPPGPASSAVRWTCQPKKKERQPTAIAPSFWVLPSSHSLTRNASKRIICYLKPFAVQICTGKKKTPFSALEINPCHPSSELPGGYLRYFSRQLLCKSLSPPGLGMEFPSARQRPKWFWSLALMRLCARDGFLDEFRVGT